MRGGGHMKRSSGAGFGLFLAGGILTLGAGAAHAASLLPVSLDEMVERAETIVAGRVVEQEARFNDDRTLILTYTTLAVDETLAGKAGATVVVSEYGGQVGDLGLVVPGMPSFVKGERVVLFLCHDDLGLLRTCGATQGRLSLMANGDGSTEVRGTMAGRPIELPLESLRAEIAATRGRAAR